MRAKINLLPPEVKARHRAEIMMLGAASIGLVVAVVLLFVYGFYFIQNYEAETKLNKLVTANEELSKITTDLQKYKNRQEQLDKQKTMIQNISKLQIDWADLINDLAMLLPGEVWLTDMKANIPSPAEMVKNPSNTDQNSLSTLVISGYSLTGQPGVAKVLTRLAEVPLLKDVTLNFAQESNYGQRRLTQFEVKATIVLPAELSGFKAPAPAPAPGATGGAAGDAGTGGGK